MSLVINASTTRVLHKPGVTFYRSPPQTECYTDVVLMTSLVRFASKHKVIKYSQLTVCADRGLRYSDSSCFLNQAVNIFINAVQIRVSSICSVCLWFPVLQQPTSSRISKTCSLQYSHYFSHLEFEPDNLQSNLLKQSSASLHQWKCCILYKPQQRVSKSASESSLRSWK